VRYSNSIVASHNQKKHERQIPIRKHESEKSGAKGEEDERHRDTAPAGGAEIRARNGRGPADPLGRRERRLPPGPHQSTRRGDRAPPPDPARRRASPRPAGRPGGERLSVPG